MHLVAAARQRLVIRTLSRRCVAFVRSALSCTSGLISPMSLALPAAAVIHSNRSPAPPETISPPLPTPRQRGIQTRFLPPAPPFSLHASYSPPAGSRTLILGDIHGCYAELVEIVEKVAGIQPSRGDKVVCVGDLVGKGPDSEKVVEYIRKNGFLSTLGNHDQYLLKCALMGGRLDGKSYNDDKEIEIWSEETCRKCGLIRDPAKSASEAHGTTSTSSDENKSSNLPSDPNSSLYARTYYARAGEFSSVAKTSAQHYHIAQRLSDVDLEWLATRPITISIPISKEEAEAAMPKTEQGKQTELPSAIVLCHAGLVPHIRLREQHIFDASIMRNWDPVSNLPSEKTKIGQAWSIHAAQQNNWTEVAKQNDGKEGGKAMVVFGHDAVRGFQRPNPYALGLDTGCCYGKYLTGLLLPDMRIVCVSAKEVYSKPSGDSDEVRRPPLPSGQVLSSVPFEMPVHPAAQGKPQSL